MTINQDDLVLEDIYLTVTAVCPDVTIVVPHYNAPEFCLQAIKSLDAGHYNIGVLILDDGSTTQNYEKLKHLLNEVADSVASMRVVRTINTGAYHSRLFAVGLAESTYIKFLDQDDVLIPGILEKEIAIANETASTVLMTDWYETWISPDASRESKHHSAPEYEDPILGFITKGGVFTSAALYRQTVFMGIKPVTGWSPRLSDDWVIFGQVVLQVIAMGGSYVTLHEPSYQWRHHDAQQSNDSPIGHTREFYQFLSWFEENIRQANIFSAPYASALATYYTKNAIFLCYADQKLWKEVVSRIKRLDTHVVLWLGHGRLVKILVRYFGIEYGICLYVQVKKLISPFPFSKHGA